MKEQKIISFKPENLISKDDLNAILKTDIEDGEYFDDWMALLDIAYEQGCPTGVYADSYVENMKDNTVLIDEITLTGSILTVKLKDIHRVFPYIATCGKELDSWAKGIEDPLYRYYADMVNQIFAGKVVEKIKSTIQNEYTVGKLSSLNPGSLSSWPITQQKELFQLLGSGSERIGVKLTESSLMVPVKSVSGILFPSEIEWYSCMNCPRHDCPGRKAPQKSDDT